MKVSINSELSEMQRKSQELARYIYNMKDMYDVTRLMPKGKECLVKEIVLKDKDSKGKVHDAKIIYLRKFTEGYEMKRIDKTEAINGIKLNIPKEEYPSDIIDKDLLRLVSERYPSAQIKVKSSLLLFNTNACKLKANIRKFTQHKTITLRIEPENFEDINDSNGNVSCPFVVFHLYTNDDYFMNEILINTISVSEWRNVCEVYLSKKDTVFIC